MSDITRMLIELDDGRRIIGYPEGGCHVERYVKTGRGSVRFADAMPEAELAELLRRAAVHLADTAQRRLGDVAVAICERCDGKQWIDGQVTGFFTQTLPCPVCMPPVVEPSGQWCAEDIIRQEG